LTDGPAPSPEGECWGAFTIDRPSRFIVAWAAGRRDADLAYRLVRQTRERTAGRAGIAWVSDGWAPYGAALQQVYRDPLPVVGVPWEVFLPTPGLRWTQIVKHRQGRRLTEVEVRVVLGEPVAQPHTVHVERQNGVLRDRVACLTRKTHAFAKDPAVWEACFSLALFEHNWILAHVALRQPLEQPSGGRRYEQRTPAMALGLADHAWTLTELLTHPVYHGT
jgi:IS1 family transposase